MSGAWNAGRLAGLAGAAIGLAGAYSPVLAGGTPENILIIADPTTNEGLHVANYYLAARDIPGVNVLYLDPQASDYQQFAAQKGAGFLGTLTNRRIADHIDYVLLMPGSTFFVNDGGLLSGQCFEPKKLSMGTAFGSSTFADDLLDGASVAFPNGYFGPNDEVIFFDSETKYQNGFPTDAPSGQRQFIGGMLGFTSNDNGNTLEEVLDLIDRSVAVDGTFPAGTFYFMDNVSDPARNVRAVQYGLTTASMDALGATTKTIVGALPNGEPDPVVGLMSGFANNSVVNGNFTVSAGAFCDHLTSFAGTFDNSSQTKMSEWITKGASGTSGTVEEPCNFPSKFPHSRMHLYYFQGLSLGEAWLRSMGWVPFQQLLYGDPMTRPFTHIPSVDVPDAPSGSVFGTISLSPEATTTHPTGQIDEFELLIDGLSVGTAGVGESFLIDTTELGEGVHDVRVLAFDDTAVRATGRWIGSIDVDNDAIATPTLEASPDTGSLSTPFAFTVTDLGAGESARLVHNGRVIATSSLEAGSGAMEVYGRILGAGPVRAHAEVLDGSGAVARSAPVDLTIDPSSGVVGGPTPVAFGYDGPDVLQATSFVLELPTSFNDELDDATWNVLEEPQFATIVSTKKKIPYRVLSVNENATPGTTDSLTFRVNTPSGASNEATITWTYVVNGCLADVSQDGELNIIDFVTFQAFFQFGDLTADFNNDGVLNVLDFVAFQTAFSAGCG